ncbi:MAG: glycosyltransferase family 2 protein [Lachnospiraceae bacterium]|nr:glycosyltransferase family 2 protein [Lachnospiraceae bacterium]
MENKLLTVVIPSYNEEESIPLFYEEMMRVYKKELENKVELEILFIDDGSKDRTMEVIHSLNEKDDRVHYVSFSRNFGKEAAIYAGLENSAGDYVAILDADLQDPPALLPEMLRSILEEGYDCVGSRRVTRKGEPPIRSFFARQFYKLMSRISQADIVDGARDFQLMNRKVVNAILSMGEYNRFSKGIFGWIGYKKKWLEYENIERAAGETKWSFWKLVLYAVDGIIAFSTAPLVISSVMGIVMCLVAFVAIVFIVVRTLIFGDPTSGWPSMMCIIVLIAGIQLLSIGVLGQYMAKTYLETKNRPKYLIEEAKLKNKEVL